MFPSQLYSRQVSAAACDDSSPSWMAEVEDNFGAWCEEQADNGEGGFQNSTFLMTSQTSLALSHRDDDDDEPSNRFAFVTPVIINPNSSMSQPQLASQTRSHGPAETMSTHKGSAHPESSKASPLHHRTNNFPSETYVVDRHYSLKKHEQLQQKVPLSTLYNDHKMPNAQQDQVLWRVRRLHISGAENSRGEMAAYPRTTRSKIAHRQPANLAVGGMAGNIPRSTPL